MTTVIIIPNWNGMPFILDCLEALKSQSQAHDVVVVDNGSTDDSITTIHQKYPQVHLITLPKNTGFSGGVNAGLQYALQEDYEFAALLNNDATPTRDWLKQLLRTLQQNQKAGIVTCKLLNTDKKHIDSTGDFYATRGIAFPRGRNTPDTGQYKAGEVFAASGGASLYRVSMLRQIGLFDDYFFAYFEDVDISFRARLNGWVILYNPQSICYHSISKTSNRLGSFSRYHSIKNLPVLYLKNMPTRLLFKYLPLFTYQMTRQFVASILKGLLIVHLQAWLALLKHLPAALADRRRIQKSRVVSSREVDQLLWHGPITKIPKL